MNHHISDFRLFLSNQKTEVFIPSIVLADVDLGSDSKISFELSDKDKVSFELKKHHKVLSNEVFDQNLKFEIGHNYIKYKNEDQAKCSRVGAKKWGLFKDFLLQISHVYEEDDLEISVYLDGTYITTINTNYGDDSFTLIKRPFVGRDWKVTSGLGFPNFHKARNQLYAMDFSCRTVNKDSFGENILSVMDGVVVEAVNDCVDHTSTPEFKQFGDQNDKIKSLCGNYIIIAHKEKLFSFYAHLKQASSLVKKGQTVKAGEKIGEVGTSGYTSGPHLHFQLMNSKDFFEASSLPFKFVE